MVSVSRRDGDSPWRVRATVLNPAAACLVPILKQADLPIGGLACVEGVASVSAAISLLAAYLLVSFLLFP